MSAPDLPVAGKGQEAAEFRSVRGRTTPPLTRTKFALWFATATIRRKIIDV